MNAATALLPGTSVSKEAAKALPLKVALFSVGEVYGGVEQFLFSYSQSLRETNGVSPLVVLLEEGRLSFKLREAHIPFEILRPRFKYDVSVAWKVARLLKRNHIRILHCHGYKATVLGFIAKLIGRFILIKTEHGWAGSPGDRLPLKGRVNYFLDQWITEHYVDHVVYVTEDLMARFQPRRKSVPGNVIYNAIPKSNRAYRALPLSPTSRFTMAIIGRLCDVKGHKVLFEALKKIRSTKTNRVLVIGDGPLDRELKAYVKDKGLGSTVNFMGFQRDIKALYPSIDCLVMPSLYEGLPLTLLEAMHEKIPVIASDVGGLGEILRHDQTALLFPPGDSDDLARQIDRLSSNPALHARLAQQAHKAALDRFEIKKMSEGYLAVYRDWMEKPEPLKQGVWLSWDWHRRTRELAQALGLRLRLIDRGPAKKLDPFWPMMKTAAYLLFHRPPLVVVQNPSLVLTLIACFMKKFKSYFLVQDLHSYFVWHKDKPRYFRDIVYRFLSSYCIKRSDLTIVTNGIARRVVEEMGGRAVILQDKVPASRAGKTANLRGKKNAVFVCTYSADEPVLDVIEAARLLDPALHIYITGRIPDVSLNFVAPPNVTLTDYLPEEAYLDLLSSCDLVLALTTQEATLLCGAYEAISFHKPLVMSSTRALRSTFTKGVVFTDNEASALSRAITQAFEEQESLQEQIKILEEELASSWKLAFRSLKALLSSSKYRSAREVRS